MEIQHLNCFEGPEGTYKNKETGQVFTLANRQFKMGGFKKRKNAKKTHVGSYYAYDVIINGETVETQVLMPDFKDEVELVK